MKRALCTSGSGTLTAENIDRISELLESVCTAVGTDRRTTLRFRLSVEESLAVWAGILGEDTPVTYEVGTRLTKPFFRIRAAGAMCNPYQTDREEFGTSHSMLTGIGLLPVYSYEDGINTLIFRIQRKPLNQLVVLALVIAAALAVGFGGQLLIPEAVLTSLCDGLITPIEDTMFRILSAIAGPMIFLSVAWGIYGIGDVYTLGRVGKKLMLRYLGVVFSFCVLGTAAYPLLGSGLSSASSGGAQLYRYLEMLLDIFPGNIFSPFIDGNTLQIILLALVVGVSLIFLGQRTASVARAVEQINNIITFLMDFISRLVPYFVFIVLVQMIWSGALQVFSTVWQFAVVFLASEAILTLLLAIYTGRRLHMPVWELLRICLPSFLIAITTASSAAAFDSNMTVSKKKLGVHPSLASFSIPFGMVMFKPNTALYYLLFCFYLSAVYGVQVSVGWLLIAIVITTVSAVATPPIPGGAAATYTAIFLQLGIPAEALAVALAVDMLFDFMLTSGDMLCLLMETAGVAQKLGMRTSPQ